MGIRASTVRAFALSLPEAEERETWETATFRVRDKMFMTFSEHERRAWIKSVHDEQRALIAMDADAWFAPPMSARAVGLGLCCRRSTAARCAS
ncbi:MAG: MmcQ/YjbR family DNA-binding protein [Actinomycetota bacterium]